MRPSPHLLSPLLPFPRRLLRIQIQIGGPSCCAAILVRSSPSPSPSALFLSGGAGRARDGAGRPADPPRQAHHRHGSRHRCVLPDSLLRCVRPLPSTIVLFSLKAATSTIVFPLLAPPRRGRKASIFFLVIIIIPFPTPNHIRVDGRASERNKREAVGKGCRQFLAIVLVRVLSS